MAVATAIVLGALLLAFGARYALQRDPPFEASAIMSEIVRAPEAPTPPAPREAPPPQHQNHAAPAPPIAPAPIASGEAPLITAPQWITRPANPERFYPRAAFMRGVEGRVELACFVETDGRLSCEIESETPPDQGFGDAALALARAHVMRPAIENGAPVRARYRMIVPFTAG
jgi:TonB family protein